MSCSEENRSRVERNAELLKKHLKEGDVLTHTRCMGCIEEHAFIAWDGVWIVGIPTKDTVSINELEGRPSDHIANDISPGNVTHINRVPLESYEFLADCGQQIKNK